MVDLSIIKDLFIPIATERLLLRLPRESDSDQVMSLISDKEVSKWVSMIPHPYSEQDFAAYLNMSRQELASGQALHLLIEDRSSDKVIGGCGIWDELGFWIGREYQNQGYGFEVMHSLVKYSFNVLLADELRAVVMDGNAPSLRIFERLGFVEACELNIESRVSGLMPAKSFALKRGDYFAPIMAKDLKKVWVVGAAISDSKGRLLMTERPFHKTWGGLWELPGGKIEPGESPEEALSRELHEEIGIEVNPWDLKSSDFISFSYEDFHMIMLVYSCQKWQGTPHGKEGQKIAWVGVDDLEKYPTLLADIPFVGRFFGA